MPERERYFSITGSSPGLKEAKLITYIPPAMPLYQPPSCNAFFTLYPADVLSFGKRIKEVFTVSNISIFQNIFNFSTHTCFSPHFML